MPEDDIPLADLLNIDPAEIEGGYFMGRQVATLDRNDLLAIIGWHFRQTAHVQTEHHRRLDVLLGRKG